MSRLQHPQRLAAILRGIEQHECLDFVSVLRDAGFTQVEIPLNSPKPMHSIQLLHEHFGKQMKVGAGTVINTEQAREAVDAGASWLLSPMLNPELLEYSIHSGIPYIPGVATPTEAFSAVKQGADTLKLFPADALGLHFLKAMKSVLPTDLKVIAVGGITPDALSAWREAGADAIGCGNALYQAGMSITVFQQRVEEWVNACNEIWPDHSVQTE